MQRNTRQRAAIYQVFEEQQRPLSAEEVYRFAKEKLPGIGIATVYRTLGAFREMGHIRAFDMPEKGTYYERVQDECSHHFLCENCNRVFALDATAMPAPSKFLILRFETFSFGECPDCLHAAAG